MGMDVAPSAELRLWYGHDVVRRTEFALRYHAELRQPSASAAVSRLIETARSRPVTLVTAIHDVEHSGARVRLDHLTSCVRGCRHDGIPHLRASANS
jgi:uncharacterized protein YeaO (DUF488 family)